MAEAKDKTTKKQKEEVEAPVKETTEKVEKLIEKESKTVAKAGKRSAKAIAESEEKVAKEERKQADKVEETKPKVKHNPPKSKLERRGKKYREQYKLIDQSKQYSLKEALELATKTTTAKFDATVELHLRLNVDPKQADQNIRDNVVLPAGTGKSVRVAVLADDANVKKAKEAGADIAAGEEFLTQLDKGVLDFDVLIATPNLMAKLAKYARILGPKGLMPNPKSGTVTMDVSKAVKQAKAGKIEYRVDSTGIIHVGIGKVSFGAAKLQENAEALLSSVKQNKPASVKGAFVRSLFATTTMGPSITIDISEL